jgi:hypothetical protein
VVGALILFAAVPGVTQIQASFALRTVAEITSLVV